MPTKSVSAAAKAAAPAAASTSHASAIVTAAGLLLAGLERGVAIDAKALRAAMIASFGGSDAEGAWGWKAAYEACEAAQILFLRKFGPAMRARAASPARFLAMLTKLAALVPSHTRRSEESQSLQQFSTPIALGFVAGTAAAITPDDLVLEPSAGTGLLAIHAELAGARLALNEIADTRAGLLEHLFPGTAVTRYDAAHIHDHLDAAVRPSVVLMNPPFSAAAHVDGRVADAALRHMSSALARLADGGRLVAITGANLSPDNPSWRDGFVRLQERGRLVFSAAVDGRVYARHGTTTETRLHIIDRVPADDPAAFPASPGIAGDAATLLDWAIRLIPPRPPVTAPTPIARADLPVAKKAPAGRSTAFKTPGTNLEWSNLREWLNGVHALRGRAASRKTDQQSKAHWEVLPEAFLKTATDGDLKQLREILDDGFNGANPWGKPPRGQRGGTKWERLNVEVNNEIERRKQRAIGNVALAYETVDWRPAETGRITDVLYESYTLQSIRIRNAQAHPTRLVQSAAMASVAPPKPSYRPHLPADLVSRGLLSDAQLESVIYAGEAHSGYLAGAWTVDDTFDVVSAAPDGGENAVRFRRGWFLGDGTGAGKGRQVAGIVLDNWLKGRRRALWVSKSDKLIEDAQRDWSALGQERLQVTPLSRFRQGTPIRLEEGILFTTYATLRSDAREEKASRVRQIVDWLGRDFDGVIVFDESHAMQNAAGAKGERGEQAASQQGRAGLRLQHALPDARVVYVSATGATTVHNLAYAQRLGLWGGADFPFATRAEFVEAMEAGGVAAMEVLARDLKALGLYAARSLSYEGIEYELVEHRLTPEQIRIYDAYADAFQVIHNNLDAALKAANIIGDTGTLNAQAKSAARSAFESMKQRFFGHLLTSMKTPSLIQSIEHDLAAGHAAVIQIVSTGEALMERRLSEIPTEEWDDVQIDLTPREYVCDYLSHGFPTQLFEPYTDSNGNLASRPVLRDGQPVQCRDAVERRDRMIEHLASLAPVQGALDQIVQRFGTDVVAEVTGRSRRIVRKRGEDGVDRLVVEARAGSANLAETQAFMDDEKRILVFSDAGGTGRSYHADLAAKNQRLRVHYLLEPGWKADTAIQGLGRSNRTNQAQPPLFRPIATDVKAEKRFLSTIARRLDTLGAITKGQRQTGGQGLFRSDDNLESAYARAALRQLYLLIYTGRVKGCSLQAFEAATGLALADRDGSLREDLPPITTFLNRLLALRIDLQNTLFGVFDELLRTRIEGAIASGTYDVGVETVTADSLKVIERRTLHVHPASGAETQVFTLHRRDRIQPFTLAEALDAAARDPRARLMVNTQSGRAAIQVPAPSLTLDDGEVQRRVRLIKPMERPAIPLAAMARSFWRDADRAEFARAWEAEVAALPAFAESTLHVVTGLLLPIWKQLPNDSMRVYRLQTDDGERIIGRLVSPAWVAQAAETEAPALAPDDAFAAVRDGRTILHLQDGLAVRRAKVMGDFRIEVSCFSDGMVQRLKAMGLVSEIISWKLRLFVPVSAAGPAVLGALMERYPLMRITERSLQ